MEGSAERLVVPHHRLHADQVDDAPEARLDAERELDHDPEEGVTGVKADWHDKAKKKNNKGTELAGKADNAKILKRTYATKQSAARAAALEWAKIKEVREIIAENNQD